MTMKVLHGIVLCLVSYMSYNAKIVDACSCLIAPSVAASVQNNVTDYIFRGSVRRQITVGSGDFNDPKYFTVRVWRVFKGCALNDATSIVVETPGNSGLCGIDLQVNENYLFFGQSETANPEVIGIAAEKSPNVLTTEMVLVQLCDYIVPFKPLPQEDKTLVRSLSENCPE
jgi:Tissue inhibitor of metalloproteinase